MTNGEIERAIEFLLKSQAAHDTQIGEMREQVAETNRIVQMHAETQGEIIQIVTKALGDLADTQRQAEARTAQAFGDLAGAQRQAEAHIANLADAQRQAEARIANLADAQRQAEGRATKALGDLAESQRRTDTRIVEIEERNSRRYDELDSRIDRLVGVVERLAESRGKE